MLCNRSLTKNPFKYLVALLGLLMCLGAPYAALAASASSGASSKPALTKAQREGKKLAFSRKKGNCLACHEIDDGDMPGTVGPKLSDVRHMIPKRSVLFKHIWDETQFNPRTPMPPFGKHLILTKKEINKIIDYLYTQ